MLGIGFGVLGGGLALVRTLNPGALYIPYTYTEIHMLTRRVRELVSRSIIRITELTLWGKGRLGILIKSPDPLKYHKPIEGLGLPKFYTDSNPSTRTIKRTIFKDFFGCGTRLQRLATIRWLLLWGKWTRSKYFLVGTNPDNRGIQYIPIHFLINRGSRAPMTQEWIPILSKLSSRSPNHSFNLAPSIPYSGRRKGPQIVLVLALGP